MEKVVWLMILCTLCACQGETNGSQGENFVENVNKVNEDIQDDSDALQFFENPKQPLTPNFEFFPSGSIYPKGWILNMMRQDLQEGLVGALAHLYPGIQADDLYNTARRGGMEDIPEMGDLVLTGADWEKSIMWWNAETIGNWWDGFVRHAFLTQDSEAIEQSHAIVNNLLQSQGEDGYLGIYKPNLRYQHEGSNGELWAQTTAFRTLLAYYEFTQMEAVLAAVEKAMSVTMEAYGEEGRNPFYLKNAFGGVTHGLMLTDVCETLYRITKKNVYQEYATYLYRAFSTYSINRSFNDLRYPYLMEKDSLFEGHAVHTYEHIRALVQAYYSTGYPELGQAYQNMLAKLETCLLPSGAGHGNEWISKLEAHPEHTASEYCSMLELRNSYGSILQKTGDVQFADRAEKLTYNAMLGARNSTGTAISYSKADNCYIMDGKHHEDGETRDDPRYKYSPTHSEPAVCCTPNYGRNLSYFVEQMWMKAPDGIAAVMYGPTLLSTEIDGKEVSIEQRTNYPMSDQVTFVVKLNSPTTFTLHIRKPAWTKAIQSDANWTEAADGFYSLQREWQDGEEVSVYFENEVQIQSTRNQEAYLQRGPLVYAYEIPHQEESIKKYTYRDFEDYYCFPTTQLFEEMALSKAAKFNWKTDEDAESFHKGEVFLECTITKSQRKAETLKLVPMGKTILRRVSFPLL
ncbi:MAG: glycoside hydrolase family 127 protein [Saprospiraceae bacterium]|nr:glycoside hydrolase family 127 protein [Saprospiraceae bacterium]